MRWRGGQFGLERVRSGRILLSSFSCGNAADELGHKPTIRDIHTRDDGIRQVHLRAGDVSAEQRGDN